MKTSLRGLLTSRHQLLFHKVLETKGIKTPTYYAALNHIRTQCRNNGIDAALKHLDPCTGKEVELDALLFCDVRGAGQNIAAQAGSSYPTT